MARTKQTSASGKKKKKSPKPGEGLARRVPVVAANKRKTRSDSKDSNEDIPAEAKNPITYGRTPNMSYEGAFLDFLKIQLKMITSMESSVQGIKANTEIDETAHLDTLVQYMKVTSQMLFCLHDKTKEMRSGSNPKTHGFVYLHKDRKDKFATFDVLFDRTKKQKRKKGRELGKELSKTDNNDASDSSWEDKKQEAVDLVDSDESEDEEEDEEDEDPPDVGDDQKHESPRPELETIRTPTKTSQMKTPTPPISNY